ncbi:hypothetical protein [Streptomyces johnsoniae]|uniref:Uncharacterized protein n=1 Tax=Streptomyces johnsoniae TaxID=3075532 RepID=A0ABU2S181_9ACTN|nr:hypothetical protein [Streptomyces sp. DSM 41886]MDT0441845.1 hypothetical protein [Streptomyces sp. DSM 41886]
MTALRRARHRRRPGRCIRAWGLLGARAGELLIAANLLGLAALVALVLVAQE